MLYLENTFRCFIKNYSYEQAHSIIGEFNSTILTLDITMLSNDHFEYHLGKALPKPLRDAAIRLAEIDGQHDVTHIRLTSREESEARRAIQAGARSVREGGDI